MMPTDQREKIIHMWQTKSRKACAGSLIAKITAK